MVRRTRRLALSRGLGHADVWDAAGGRPAYRGNDDAAARDIVLAIPWPATETAREKSRCSLRQDPDRLHETLGHGPRWARARARPGYIWQRAGGGLDKKSSGIQDPQSN